MSPASNRERVPLVDEEMPVTSVDIDASYDNARKRIVLRQFVSKI